MYRIAIALGAFALFFSTHTANAAQYGVASYYWQPQKVAAGGVFNPHAMSAAHKSLPFGSVVRVTRLSTGRSVVVTINDRGPYIRGRIIDLSRRAAQRLGMAGAGVTRVRVDVIGRASRAKVAAISGGSARYMRGRGGTFSFAKANSKIAAKTPKSKIRTRKARTRIASNKTYPGVPAGKRVTYVNRKYRLNGQVRNTSGRIPAGAVLLEEVIEYTG